MGLMRVAEAAMPESPRHARRIADGLALAIAGGGAYVAAAAAAVGLSYLVSGRPPIGCIGGVDPTFLIPGLAVRSPSPLVMRDVIQIAATGGTLLIAMSWVLHSGTNRTRARRTVTVVALAPVAIVVAGWIAVSVGPHCL